MASVFAFVNVDGADAISFNLPGVNTGELVGFALSDDFRSGIMLSGCGTVKFWLLLEWYSSLCSARGELPRDLPSGISAGNSVIITFEWVVDDGKDITSLGKDRGISPGDTSWCVVAGKTIGRTETVFVRAPECAAVDAITETGNVVARVADESSRGNGLRKKKIRSGLDFLVLFWNIIF